jgi:guanylate kinase
MRGLLVVVSGPSGVGKGTLLSTVLGHRNDFVYSISATTRNPRPGEVHGRHYHFLDHSTFSTWVEQGRFLEWNQVHDQFYGTPREFVEQQRQKGLSVVLDIDVQGALQVMEAEPDNVSIFIVPPDLETLRQRLTNRGTETPEQVHTRMLTARVELRAVDHYHYTVINDEIGRASANLESIIVAEGSRTKRLREGNGIPRFEPPFGAGEAG